MSREVNSRKLVKDTVLFRGIDGLAMELPHPYRNDFYRAAASPHPDARPYNSVGADEWGAVWENIGISFLGEVKHHPLKEWADLPKLHIPDPLEESRWTCLEGIREKAGDRLLMGFICSLYERIHFLRGLENTWVDIYENPDELKHIIGVLADINVKLIDRYAALGFDACIMADDWGLQNRLMISPESWREFWKPAYTRVFAAAHAHNMLTFMHSCGYTIQILGDLIEAGLDVIQYDQQENMTLEALSKYSGKITYFCPVDIQTVMSRGNEAEIRAYARKLVSTLGTEKGGFIAMFYSDPKGAGHTDAAVAAMCEEFMRIDAEIAEGRFR